MATHSSTLAWKIPWAQEPSRLQSMGSLGVGVAGSRARLGDFTFTFHLHALEKKMATHASILAWRIPGTEEPSGLPSMGSHSRTRLKRFRSSSSKLCYFLLFMVLAPIGISYILISYVRISFLKSLLSPSSIII